MEPAPSIFSNLPWFGLHSWRIWMERLDPRKLKPFMLTRAAKRTVLIGPNLSIGFAF